ncbi:hypothetical protein HanRHA438_Chr01g0038721 [Helianthus annuus]|nr:hypothetical protein HanRHA438_Chr01g0038721 [Helianthus annuus]
MANQILHEFHIKIDFSCLFIIKYIISPYYTISSITCIPFHLLIPPRHFIKHLVCMPQFMHNVQVFHALFPTSCFHSSINTKTSTNSYHIQST